MRVSTTVDEQLLKSARRAHPELPDSALLDEALAALLARHPAVEIDAAYAAYDELQLINFHRDWPGHPRFKAHCYAYIPPPEPPEQLGFNFEGASQ